MIKENKIINFIRVVRFFFAVPFLLIGGIGMFLFALIVGSFEISIENGKVKF